MYVYIYIHILGGAPVRLLCMQMEKDGGDVLLVSNFVKFIGNIFITTDCMQSTLNESSIGTEPELGDIRLSDGCSGELEVYSNLLNSGGWYSVCAASTGFYNSVSRLVCKQLGCPVAGASSKFRYTEMNSIYSSCLHVEDSY